MNLPNKLTVFRMLLVPVFVILMYINMPYNYLLALIVFVLAAITDALDGKIARKYNLITDFGKLMDPLADKILVIAALMCFIDIKVIPGWIVLIIVSRELSVSIMRAVAACDGKVIAAGSSGKLKTVVQMVGIVVLLFGIAIDINSIILTGQVLVYISAVLTLYSGIEYFYKNRELFSDM